MKTETFSGKMDNVYGNAVSFYKKTVDGKPLTSIPFKGEFSAYESLSEVPEDEKPSEEDIVDYVNNKRKANARQKSMQAAIDAYGIVKPTLAESEELQLKEMIKIFVAKGKTPEVAEQLAKAALSA